MPVVALLAAHVEIALGGIVVEVADSLLGATVQADIERNVLVEGIRLLGVVAHGVAGSHIHVFLGLVDLAGFLAEAVEAVVGLDLAGVDAAVVAVLAVGQVGNIGVQQAAVLIIDHDAERCLLDDDLETRPWITACLSPSVRAAAADWTRLRQSFISSSVRDSHAVMVRL
mgnify:CR=1 FL=1